MVALPKVSVVVPVYNAGEKLVLSIESLLSQSLEDIEIVIVNDASTDDSAAVIDRLSCNNAKVVGVHLSQNKGVHEARLEGLRKSTAPWIGFLDADDYAHQSMFELMLAAGEKENVDIVLCGSMMVDGNGKKIRPKVSYRKNERVDNEVFERFVNFEFGSGVLWNKLYRRSVVLPSVDIGFPWRQNYNEDVLLNIGCFWRAKTVFLMKDVLHKYVQWGSSATATIPMAAMYVETFKAFACAVKSYHNEDSELLLGITELYRNQLSWSCYLVEGLDVLGSYHETLQKAAGLVCSYNPELLALLAARKNKKYNISALLRMILGKIWNLIK